MLQSPVCVWVWEGGQKLLSRRLLWKICVCGVFPVTTVSNLNPCCIKLSYVKNLVFGSETGMFICQKYCLCKIEWEMFFCCSQITYTVPYMFPEKNIVKQIHEKFWIFKATFKFSLKKICKIYKANIFHRLLQRLVLLVPALLWSTCNMDKVIKVVL